MTRPPARPGATAPAFRRAPFSAALLAALLAFALSLPACGRRSSPEPPEDVLPATINDLAAKRGKSGITLSWSRPDKYVGGRAMIDLAAFTVERGPLRGIATGFVVIARLEVKDQDRFRQIKKFHYVDEAADAAKAYRYRVVSATLDGYLSAPSNVAEVAATIEE